MSTKNFVSYGDAETLFTGVGNKLGNKADNADLSSLSNVYAQFGEKNLNTYPYYETTTSRRGIIFTDNGDGTITASGTNDGTGNSLFDCHTRVVGENHSLILPNGEYILNGCPNNNPGGNSFYLAAQATINNAGVTLGNDIGEGVLIKLNGDDYSQDSVEIQLRIVINKNVALSEPVTFYPMLRLATVKDGTWTPYVKSNKQLTDDVDDILDGTSIDSFGDVETALAGKQSTLTFDNVPTDGSNNPVKSDGIYDALSGKSDLTNLAPAFSAETAYAVGQYVSYDGKIYKCTSAHSAGAWAAVDFTVVAVGSELSTINSNIASKAPIDTSMVCLPIGTTSDGQHYSIDLTDYVTSSNRYACFIAISNQSGTGRIVPCAIDNGLVSVTDTDVTFDVTTKILSVDAGSGAWCFPILVIPYSAF